MLFNKLEMDGAVLRFLIPIPTAQTMFNAQPFAHSRSGNIHGHTGEGLDAVLRQPTGCFT
jgi:hypothetical protein